MVFGRREVCHDLFALFKTLQLMPVWVVTSTAKAMREIVWIQILDRWGHKVIVGGDEEIATVHP
jgi:hypothetical protein